MYPRNKPVYLTTEEKNMLCRYATAESCRLSLRQEEIRDSADYYRQAGDEILAELHERKLRRVQREKWAANRLLEKLSRLNVNASIQLLTD